MVGVVQGVLELTAIRVSDGKEEWQRKESKVEIGSTRWHFGTFEHERSEGCSC